MRNLIYGLFLLAIVGCRAPLGAPAVQPRIYNVDDTHDPDATVTTATTDVATLIAPYKAQLDERMNRVLATLAAPLKKGSPESTLGNWTADLTLAAARTLYPDRKIAFATLNSGGLRVQEIGAGPLIVSEVYELMPFDNELVLMELSGRLLTEFVSHIANSGGWPVSAGLSVSKAGGKLKVLVDGQPVNPTATYTVALPDYVANGGSNSAMLEGKPQLKSGRLLRDLWLEEAAKATGPITVTTDGSRFRL